MDNTKITKITEEQKQGCQKLLGYIRIKINYLKIDLLRKHYKDKNREFLIKEDQSIEDIAAENVHHIISDSEIQMCNSDILNTSILNLSSLQKKFIYLYFIRDYSQKEIASFMNISPSAVTQLKKRSLERLKEDMEGRKNG